MFSAAGGLLPFFFLLYLSLIHETTEAATGYVAYPALNRTQVPGFQTSDISLGSNLSANAADSWLSASGRFAFGFYPKGNGFLVGIQLFINSSSSMVVWTARPDLNPFSKNAILIFTAAGFLLVPNSRSAPPFLLYSFSSKASYAAMLKNGNFVVYSLNSTISKTKAVSLADNDPLSPNRAPCYTRGEPYSRCNNPNAQPYTRSCNKVEGCRTSSDSPIVIWRSFDYPTDTILGSQSLLCGHNLTSTAAGNNPSPEIHILSMQCDGNLVFYPANSAIATWASETSGENYRSLALDDGGRLYLSNDAGSNKDLSGYKPENVQVDMIYAARIDADNIFRLYAVNLDANTSSVVNEVPYYKDKCYAQQICGVNSFCLLVNDAPSCKCVPGFTYIQPSAPAAGCRRIRMLPRCKISGGATVVSMEKAEHVVGLDELAYFVVSAATGDDCSSKCLDDCDCYASYYRDQQCSKLKMPLSGARFDSNDPGVAFMKLSVDAGSSHSGNDTTKREIRVAAITVSAFVAGVICLMVIAAAGGSYWFLFGRFREQWEKWELAFSEEIAPRYFDYNELLNGPSSSRTELGRGAHGTVFRVKLPMGGISVAVKKLHGGESEAEKNFQTEMSIIGRARHANLVRLIGFCHDGPCRLLVYEYMCRYSLAKCIFESQKDREDRKDQKDRHGWARLIGLLLGAARGIHYLHRECEIKIIHRDIKPENILISEDWTAKISDFGLAKLVIASQANAATRTAAVGTDGYIAPECKRGDEKTGDIVFTEKADVFSYGVVVLETVCGARIRDVDVRKLARKCYDAGELWKLVDGELVAGSEVERVLRMGNEEVKESEIARAVKIGMLCVQEDPDARPSMEDVVMMLEGDMDVPIPPPL